MYFGADIGAAEAGLLEYRDSILRSRTDYVRGVDYDFLLWAVSARLYKISAFKGDRRKADDYLLDCARYRLHSPMMTESEADRPFEKRYIDDFLKKLDGDRMQWQKKQ